VIRLLLLGAHRSGRNSAAQTVQSTPADQSVALAKWEPCIMRTS
jgi:hypothetical protein